MSHRAWWLVIATLLLLGIAIALHDGLRRGHDRLPRETDAIAVRTATPTPMDTAARDMDADAQRLRNETMAEAVTTLHAYVAALFKDDRSEADGLWAGGRPATQGEADLRALDGVTGVRIDNAQPQPLDVAPVPAQLRIPVRLRVGGQGPLRRYEGHYDLRHERDGWRISGASIDLSPVRG